MRAILGAAWARWKAIAEAIAHVQAKLIFTILYFVVIAPFAIGVRLWSDPLDVRPRAGSRWKALSRQTTTLETARRQF